MSLRTAEDDVAFVGLASPFIDGIKNLKKKKVDVKVSQSNAITKDSFIKMTSNKEAYTHMLRRSEPK